MTGFTREARPIRRNCADSVQGARRGGAVFEAVDSMAEEHAELELRLGAAETHADARLAKQLNQRYAHLSRVLTVKKEWDDLGGDIEAARELAAEAPAFADEIEALAARRHAAEERLRMLLVPRDAADDK